MTRFEIAIDDGSTTLSEFAVEENTKFVELYDWQRRAIKYFFKNNVALYSVTTGCLTGNTFIEGTKNFG